MDANNPTPKRLSEPPQDFPYRQIVETCYEGIWIISTQLQTLYANRRMAEMLNCAPGEMTGRPAVEFMFEEDRQEGRRVLEQHLREVGGRQLEFRFRRKDGSALWVILNSSPVYDGAGRLIGLIGMLTDITDRKGAEAALQESDLLFHRLMDANIIGILVVRDEKIVEANNAFLDMIGYGREDLKAGQIDWQKITPPEYAAFDRMAAEELLTAGAAAPCEKECVRKDGARVPILIGASLLDRTPLSWIGFAVDLTEHNVAEAAVRHTAELGARNETLQQRVVDRTALAEHRASQLQALAMELTQAESRERRRLAQLLHDHLQQLLIGAKFSITALRNRTRNPDCKETAQHVGDLLDESIAASRSLTFELSPPVLYDAGLTAALGWLARQMREKYGLTVDVKVEGGAEPSSVDIRVFLFQALRELLLNVVKHAGTSEACVYLGRADVGWVRAGVEDKGAGFDAKTLERGADAAGGFGLFSVRERLELMGGWMEVESAPGKGSRFTLFVPLAKLESAGKSAAAVPAPAERPAKRAAPPHRRSKKISVLLADDHKVMREGLARLLQEQPDIEVVGQASDGQMAIELAHELQPDVVIMDVSMPRMSGIEATRLIAGAMPKTRIIGLSMHEEADMSTTMRHAGAVEYLNKGGPPELLIAAIREAPARKLVQAPEPATLFDAAAEPKPRAPRRKKPPKKRR